MSKSRTKRKAAKKDSPHANYGANETPRHCRKCKATVSTVTDTKRFNNPNRTIRYRVCGSCGSRFSTIEV